MCVFMWVQWLWRPEEGVITLMTEAGFREGYGTREIEPLCSARVASALKLQASSPSVYILIKHQQSSKFFSLLRIWSLQLVVPPFFKEK